jgi:hypothetical protein
MAHFSVHRAKTNLSKLIATALVAKMVDSQLRART